MRIPNDIAIEVDRAACSGSLAAFAKRAWSQIIPDKLQWNWHLDAECEHLEACARGEITRLVINVPPGTSKSTMVGVLYPAWLWGPGGWPGHRYIGAAHEQDLAIRDSRFMRNLVESEWYQERWPVALSSSQNEKKYFENIHHGFRNACAVTSMTGRRGHTVTWDDPLNPKKAASDADRQSAIEVMEETLPSRLNDPINSVIILVMQRLHEQDPTGFVVSKELGYEQLVIPMEFEPNRRFYTSIGWTDPRTEEGELLDPVRFPRSVIDRDKAAMSSYAWAGQMQQRPSPKGGGLIRDEWWRYYKQLPRLTHRMIYADTANKTKTMNDYSVFQCWGKSTDGRAYLIDMVRGKWEAPELLTQARAFWNKHKALNGTPALGRLRKMGIEDKSSGTGLIQTLRRPPDNIPIEAIQRDTDKISRCMDILAEVENGNVLLPEDAPWLSDFLAESSAFPNGANDDMLDPMFDAVAAMTTLTAAERMQALAS